MKATFLFGGTVALLLAGGYMASAGDKTEGEAARDKIPVVTAAVHTPGPLRLDYFSEAPGVLKAMSGLEEQVRNSGLEKSILVLVKIRASQLNQCLYCLDMHEREAVKIATDQAKLDAVAKWRESELFSPRERAALAWTDALTLISKTTITDELFNEVSTRFKGGELANLSLAIIATNGWNRLNIGFRDEPQRCPIDF